MSRTVSGVLIGALALVLLVAVLVIRGCGSEPSKVEVRADSVLVSVPAWKDSLRARDSVIAVRDQERARLRRLSTTQRLRADSAEAKADSLQAWADGLAEVPTNLTPVEQNIQLRTALAAQIKTSVQFRLVVDTLKSQRTTDSLRLVGADSTIAELQQWRAQDRTRIDLVTKALADLRAETKHRGQWNLFGIHLPGYVKDAVLVGAVGYGGYRIGRGAS